MTNKPRIAFLCHPYHRGGVTRWMADAAIACAQKGLEVYFVTVAPVKDFFSAKGRETLLQLIGNDTTIHIIKASAGNEFELGTPEYRVYVYQKLLVLLPIGTPVILSDDSAVWEAAAALHNSYPVIGVLHADDAPYYELAEKHYRQVAALVCVSNRVSSVVQGRIPAFNTDRLYTIPCGINLPVVTFSNTGNNILQLVYVGRVSDYQKRTGDLVNICKLLAEKNIKFHLQIIGDGEAKEQLINRFRETGLDPYVTFCGWLSQQQVSSHLSESDVLILTSDFEGMPIAVMEALASGCGVVSTRVSGVEDYEYHPLAPDCLSVFTVGDMEDAVTKINKVAAIPKGIRQQAARKLAVSEFSMQVCLDKYFKVITGIKIIPVPPQVTSLSSFKMLYSSLLSAARKMKVGMKS